MWAPSRVRIVQLLSISCIVACAAVIHAQGGPPFRTDDPETPGNKHWEINFGFIGQRNPAAGSYQVPDFDINYGLGDRVQLKYEIPIAIQESRPLSPSPNQPAQEGIVLAGLGSSLMGVKIRFFEHHPGDLLALRFRHRPASSHAVCLRVRRARSREAGQLQHRHLPAAHPR